MINTFLDCFGCHESRTRTPPYYVKKLINEHPYSKEYPRVIISFYTRSAFTTNRFIAPIIRGFVHEGETKIVYIPNRFPPHKSVIMPLPTTAVSFFWVPSISKAAINAFFFGLLALNKAGISLTSSFPCEGGLLFETIISLIAYRDSKSFSQFFIESDSAPQKSAPLLPSIHSLQSYDF